MAENRGGMRPTAPQNNPANISATGGAGQSGTQAARYIPGMSQLGSTGVETMAQQQSAPMAGPSQSTPTMPPIVPLTSPTERVNEPITTGMDFGPGAGSEALNLPRERSLSEILASMIDVDPTGDVQELYNYVASRGL